MWKDCASGTQKSGTSRSLNEHISLSLSVSFYVQFTAHVQMHAETTGSLEHILNIWGLKDVERFLVKDLPK